MTLARPSTGGIDPQGRSWDHGAGVPLHTRPQGWWYFQTDGIEGGTTWRQMGPGAAANWRSFDELSVQDVGDLTGTALIDFDQGAYAHGVLTGNIELAVTGLVPGGVYTLEVESGAGGFTIDWSDVTSEYAARYFTSNGLPPVMTGTPAKIDVYSMLYREDRLLVWASQGA